MNEIIVSTDLPEHTAGAISEAEAVLIAEAEATAKAEAKAIQDAKEAKALALATITVTTSNGNTFDGNETARTDMLSAILTSDTMVAKAKADYEAIASPTEAQTTAYNTAMLSATQTPWKLSDNSIALVTADEVREALALAIQAKGQIILGGAM